MPIARAALIVLGLVLLRQSPGSTQASRDAAEPLLAGVVEVYASAPAQRLLGSGFVVHHDPEHALVVTASHVVDGVNSIDVAFRDRAASPYQATLIAAADDTDLALLRVSWTGRQPPAAGPSFIVGNPSTNDMLLVIGSAGDLHWARTSAGMLTLPTDPANVNRFRFDRGTAEQGFSGGPVINASTGQLVGVLQRLVGQQALALKIEPALDVIDSAWGIPVLNRIERRKPPPSAATAVRVQFRQACGTARPVEGNLGSVGLNVERGLRGRQVTLDGPRVVLVAAGADDSATTGVELRGQFRVCRNGNSACLAFSPDCSDTCRFERMELRSQNRDEALTQLADAIAGAAAAGIEEAVSVCSRWP